MATDKLVDFDHVTDYISREAAKAKKIYSVERRELVVPVAEIDWIPPAEVVARDCYDRILAENDTMRNQLAKVGKKVGDSMDDVRPVARAHWIYHEDDCGDYYECSHCHDEYVVYEDDMCWKHCPACGAYMEKMITGKEENGRT